MTNKTIKAYVSMNRVKFPFSFFLLLKFWGRNIKVTTVHSQQIVKQKRPKGNIVRSISFPTSVTYFFLVYKHRTDILKTHFFIKQLQNFLDIFFSFYRYIADAGSRAILVHDVANNKSHRVLLPPAVGNGSSKNDVLYMVLIRKGQNSNVLYFTYLGSDRLYSIKTEHLQKGTGSTSVVDIGAKPDGRPIVLLGTDNGTSMFLRYKGMSDIYLWNTETCFKSKNFLEVQKGGDCRLSTQVMPGQKRYMWTIESNFHHYIADTVGCTGASVVIHPVVRENED